MTNQTKPCRKSLSIEYTFLYIGNWQHTHMLGINIQSQDPGAHNPERATATLGNLIKHDGDGWLERHKTKGFSLPSSAKQQRKMTKFKVLCTTWTHDSEFSFFYLTVTPSFQSQLPDCSATLDRLNELKLSRRSLKHLEVICKVTFSLPLPSWLLKFPNICGKLVLRLFLYTCFQSFYGA